MNDPHPDHTLPGDLPAEPPDPLPEPPQPDVCSGPSHPPATVMEPGTFRIRFPGFAVEWGDKDLRDTHTDEYVFCSFACLAAWATERSLQHDDAPVVEGDAPHPEHPIVLPEGVDVGE